VPRFFTELGPDTLVPKIKPHALELKLTAEEGFVLSRIDGRLSIGEICLLVPFDPEVTATILLQLTRHGAIDMPGHAIPEVLPSLEKSESITAPPPPTRIERPTVDGLDLPAEAARRIDELYASLEQKDAFQLLELGRTDDKKEIKRAYFKLSKELHPDRYFGKNIGPYREKLSKIFQSVKAAYDLLIDDARRTAYLESVDK
jgi:DnaJ-domain-containing protein 1